MNFGPNNIDYSKTSFSKFELTEDKYGDKSYEYRCSYALVIKYKNLQTDNKQLNRLAETESFGDSDILVKTYESRPEWLNKYIAPEDDQEGTVDYALNDFIKDRCAKDSAKFQLMVELFGVNVPQKILEKAYSGNYELSNSRKLTSVEFNYRKPAVEAVTISYEDGKTFTVDLNHKVTNRDVDAIIPDMTLPEIYSHVDDWLEEDYEGTLGLLKEIFGFDFQTLKGANVR